MIHFSRHNWTQTHSASSYVPSRSLSSPIHWIVAKEWVLYIYSIYIIYISLFLYICILWCKWNMFSPIYLWSLWSSCTPYMKFHLHPTARPALLGPFAFLLGIFALSRGIPMATMCFGKCVYYMPCSKYHGKMSVLAFREAAVGYLKDEICNQVLQISEGAWHILGGYWYILLLFLFLSSVAFFL